MSQQYVKFNYIPTNPPFIDVVFPLDKCTSVSQLQQADRHPVNHGDTKQSGGEEGDDATSSGSAPSSSLVSEQDVKDRRGPSTLAHFVHSLDEGKHTIELRRGWMVSRLE